MGVPSKYTVNKCAVKYEVVGGNWFYNHNRKMAIIFGGCIFLVMVVLTFTNKQEDSANTTLAENVFMMRSFESNQNPCSENNKQITCSDTPANTIEENINLLALRGVYKLTLNKINFDKTFPKDWLKNVTVIFESLRFNYVELDNIEEYALSQNPFESIKELFFVNSLSNIKKHFFNKMNFLENLEINFFNTQSIEIEVDENALEYVAGTLQTLYFERLLKNGDQATFLFGQNSIFSLLETLRIEGNNFENINENTFTAAYKTTQFFLERNNIKTIHKDAFKNFYKLQKLHLKDNALSTLEDGIFDFAKTQSYITINLEGNSLNCNCDLYWLQNFVKEYPNIIQPEPICTNGGLKNITEFPFNCPVTTTTPNVDITPSTEVSTEPQINIKTFTMDCSSSEYFAADIPTTYMGKQTIIKNQTLLDLHFYTLDTLPLGIMIQIDGDITNYALIWFNTLNRTQTGCLTNIGNEIKFSRFERENTYTMCVKEKSNPSVSPYDCFGVSVPPSKDRLPLFLQEDLADLIAISAGVLIGVIVLTGCIVFCCIRRNPKLIKGSDKVIIVNRKKETGFLLNNNFKPPMYVPPSNISLNDVLTQSGTSGYLTPRDKKYAKIKYRSPYLKLASQYGYKLDESMSLYADIPSAPAYWRSTSTLKQDENIDRTVFNVDYEIKEDEAPPLPPPNKSTYQRASKIYSIT